jgi:hypothetical protein
MRNSNPATLKGFSAPPRFLTPAWKGLGSHTFARKQGRPFLREAAANENEEVAENPTFQEVRNF